MRTPEATAFKIIRGFALSALIYIEVIRFHIVLIRLKFPLISGRSKSFGRPLQCLTRLGHFGLLERCGQDRNAHIRKGFVFIVSADHKYVDMKVGSEGCVLSMRREKEHANGPGSCCKD